MLQRPVPFVNYKYMKQKVWWHGTNYKNAKAILKSGKFKKDTWFARHLEDAIKFGGKYVFTVTFTVNRCPLKWQVCLLNELSAENIISLDKYEIKNKYLNKKLEKETFNPHT